MATAVQIELLVDEKGAVQGVRTFDAAIKGTQNTTTSLDATLKQLNATLEKTATSGAAAGRGAGRGLRQVKEEGMTARESVRLVTEQFGIEMPRAFKELISKSSGVATALKMVSGALVGIASIQIGAMIFEQLYEGAHKLWEEHLSLTKAAEDYNDELEKIKQQDFGNTRSIETTKLRIEEATAAVENYRRQAEAAQNYHGMYEVGFNSLLPGLGTAAQWYANRSAAHDLQQKQYEEQRQLDKLQHEQLVEQQHEQRMAQIELNHAKDEELNKEQRITAELQKQQEIIGENARYTYERETARGNTAARPSSFDLANGRLTPDAMKQLQAQSEADVQTFELRKEQTQELRQLQEQALEARLRGTALYEAQEAFAIEQLKNKDMDSVAARKAIHDKFHAEELKRLQAEEFELAKLREQTAVAGLSGVAKVRQEGQNRINELYRQNATSANPMNPGQLLAAVNELSKQTGLQITQMYQAFGDQVDSVLSQSTERTLQGFARIHAEAQRQISDLEKNYRDKGGRPEDLERGEAGIRSDERSQVAQLERHNADETAQIEAQARAHSLSAERQQTLAIESEYNERVRQYREQLDQQLISQDDFNRRVAAADQERNAQMVDAARQAREKMAGEFSHFLSNPLAAMKEMGEKAAGEAAASLWQRIQNPAIPQHGGGFGDQWSLDKIFARIGGHPAATGTVEAHRAETMASGAFTLATAEIRVGSASITLPAAIGAAGAGVPYASSGPTSLLGNVPGSFGGGGTDLASISGPMGHGGAPSLDSGVSNLASSGRSAIAAVSADSGMPTGAAAVLYRAQHSTNMPQVEHAAIGGFFDQKGNFSPDLKRGIFGTDNTNSGMLSGGGFKSNVGGAATGAMGIFSAYEGNGGFGGAASGALSGAKLGMALGGPMGAAIGAIGGAIVGAIGFGGREKARVYDLKTVRPRLAADFQGFQAGSMDYTSAYSDMQALDQESRKTLDKMGGSARRYYWDTINKEIHLAEAKLTAEEKAGRSQFTMSAAQYDQGGWAGGFGAMATGPNTGWAHMRRGEFVVTEQPAAEHAGALEAIRAGASHADMARYYGLDSSADGYRTAMRGSVAGSGSSSSVTHNWNVRAWDSKSVVQMLYDNKHHIRGAVNSSYAENSGSADA